MYLHIKSQQKPPSSSSANVLGFLTCTGKLLLTALGYCSPVWLLLSQSIVTLLCLSLSLFFLTHTHTELEGRLIATGHTGEGLGRLLRKWSVTLEHTWGGVCAPHSSLCSQHLRWPGRYRTHINALAPPSKDHLQLNQQEICSRSDTISVFPALLINKEHVSFKNPA